MENSVHLDLSVEKTLMNPQYKFNQIEIKDQDLIPFFKSWFANSYSTSFTRDHLLLMRFTVRALALTNTVFSAEFRRKMYALILVNYTISSKEKNSLIKDLKINEKGQIKGLLDLIAKNSDVFINAPVRKSVLKHIVLNARDPAKKSFDFYLEDRLMAWRKTDRCTPRWSLNGLHLAVMIRRINPSWELKIFDRYSFYLGNYGISWAVKLLEKEGIVDPKSFLTEYDFVKKNITIEGSGFNLPIVRIPVSKKSIWNSNFKNLFKKEEYYNQFCETHKDFIFKTFKEKFQLLETMEGFKTPVAARELMMAAIPRPGQITEYPYNSTIKEGLHSIFGFHSSKLVNYLNQQSKELSPLDFVAKLHQGYLVRLWSKEKDGADLRWRWIKLPMPTTFFSILSRESFISRIYSVYTESQVISLWEKLLENENKADNTYHWREEYTSVQDAISMITPDVAVFLRTLSFNEINTFEKLHDIASREYTKLKNPLRELNLEKIYPSILKVEEISLSGGLKIVVPKSNHDMIHWGQYLRICVGSYADRVAEGFTLVLGVVDKGRMTHCIELVRSSESMVILQFKALRNAQGSQDLALEILEKVKPFIEEDYLKYKPVVKPISNRNPFLIFEEMLVMDYPAQLRGRATRPLPDIDIDEDGPDDE